MARQKPVRQDAILGGLSIGQLPVVMLNVLNTLHIYILQNCLNKTLLIGIIYGSTTGSNLIVATVLR